MEAHFYTTSQEFFDRYAVLFCAMPREEWRARPTDRLSLGDIEFIQIQIGKICQEEWTTDRIRDAIGQLTKHFDEKHTARGGETGQRSLRSQSLHYIRWALSGGRPGPSLAATAFILGRDNTLHRLGTAQVEFRSLVHKTDALSLN